MSDLAELVNRLARALRERPRRDVLASHALRDRCKCRHRRAEHYANCGGCLVRACACGGFAYSHLRALR